MKKQKMPKDINELAAKIAALALHFMYYNYCRIHQTLRVTPAMEMGITDHVWDIMEIVELLDTFRRYGTLIQ